MAIKLRSSTSIAHVRELNARRANAPNFSNHLPNINILNETNHRYLKGTTYLYSL